MSYVDVMASDALPPQGQKVVWVGLTRLLLCRDQGEVHALEDLCPHARQPLAGGVVEAGVVACPKHGAKFDVCSGKPVNRVTPLAVKVFPVRVREGRVEVDLG